MKTLFIPFLMMFFISACTQTFTVKNRALVLSAERFDDEVQHVSKENFVDIEQQKVFADFIKKNSRIDVSDVEVKDKEATAQLKIRTISKSIFPELKTISGKDWQAKVDANMEERSYSLVLKKSGDSWQISEQKENPKK
jgi:hypothetical protein